MFAFFLVGYVATVAIELPVYWFGLGKRYSGLQKVFAACWLTACTYPVVVLVLPVAISMVQHRAIYLLAAESFAVFGECFLFAVLAWFAGRDLSVRDVIVVVGANMASFVAGEMFGVSRWINSLV